MNTKRRKLLTTLAALTAILAFTIISASAVVWANGWRYNSSTGSFDQTVLIAVDGSAQKIEVLLDGIKVADHIPYRVRNLLPGSYTVELSKDGFQSHRQTFWLSSGQVGLINDPVLIAKQPLVTTTVSPLVTAELDAFDFGLLLTGGELTDRGELVSRFSVTPLQVHRFNDFYLYELGNELRLYLKAGSQDYLVYRAERVEKLPLALYPATWQVAVTDGKLTRLVNLTISGVSAPR